jgi:hypothetical protein
MGARDHAPRFDDRLKAAMAAAANVMFTSVVVLMWGLEGPLFGGHQLYGSSPLLFVIFALTMVLYYGALATSDRFGRLADMLVQAAARGIVAEPEGAEPQRSSRPGRARAIFANLWVPVTLNFLLAGWLIYASGGILNSPYASVPVAMMLIGQSVYGVPPIDLRGHSRLPRLVVFVLAILRLYLYPFMLIIVIELMLVALQRLHPLVRSPAPAAEFVISTLLILLASMCVTFVTRRADKASGA